MFGVNTFCRREEKKERERGGVDTWTVRGRERQKVIEKKRGRERYSDRDRETECE